MFDTNKLSKNDKIIVEELVSLIASCSSESNICPQNVQYNQFLKWAKENAHSKVFENQSVYKRLGGFSVIRDACFGNDTENLDEQIDKKKIKTQAKINKKLINDQVEEKMFMNDFEKLSSKIFEGKISPSGYSLKQFDNRKIKRELHLVLSDTHFQSLSDVNECGVGYGPVEEARRLAYIILETVEYKLQYRKETTLKLHLLGDIIKGVIHNTESGSALTTQVVAAIHLLSQAISFLAKHFPFVEVFCATGNHGRNPLRHKERASEAKWDSFETIIYYSLKNATSGLKNVKFIIPKKPYYVFDSFGTCGFGTHGDTVFFSGNVGSRIDVSSIEKQSATINAMLPEKDKYKLFLVGHMHTGTIINLHNGTKIITNGALIPPDAYAQSIGIFNTVCGQWLFESVPGHLVGDCRFIELDAKIDKDASLDKIIKPFDEL